MVTRTGIGSTTTTGGAPIIGADQTRSEGPGPEVMNAETLIGDSVVNSAGDDLGNIKAIMLDVTSGRVAYAVLSFGGFLGLGEDSYPLPWSVLTYNTTLAGYEVNVTDEQLKSAPHLRSDENWDDGNRDRDTMIYGYYGVPPYWL